jgi:Domain of unknown function (DUF4404)
MPSHLKEILAELHAELTRHPTLDAGTKESLRKVAGEITLALEGEAAEENAESVKGDAERIESETLSSRVQSFVDEFELQHPQLTKTLSTIAERLADMGI